MILIAGCRFWNEPASKSLSLPPVRMSTDAVVLEITFMRLATPTRQQSDAIWGDIDEQQVALSERRRLNANGFRYGLVGPQLPAALQQLVKPDAAAPTADSPDPSVPALATSRRLQIRSGHRSEIVTGRPQPQMTILYHDGSRLTGAILPDAQCLLAARTTALGDGRVELELVPEIHFGAPRNRWVAEDGIFLLQPGRDRRVFYDLAIRATLSPGQSLVIGGTADPIGLGSHYFLDTDSGEPQPKLLLIRLSKVQRDDLFDDSDAHGVSRAAPLAIFADGSDNAVGNR